MYTTTSLNNDSKNKSRIFILENRRFGSIKEDGSFHRTVKLSKHLLRSKNSFGIDLWLVNELTKYNCKRIVFKETEEAKRYTIGFQNFKKHSVKVDYGFGVQLMVERSHWSVEVLPKQLALGVGE